jgi:hypothetical protein
MGWPTLKADATDSHCVGVGVTPGFKVKLNAHSMCVQESSLHTYRTGNRYRTINVTIYSIYYMNSVLQKTKLNTLELKQRKDTITPQTTDRG